MNPSMQVFTTLDELASDRESLVAIRHDLHRNPELSFHEVEISDFVARQLEQWGYAVTRNVGGHGVVGTLHAGTGTRKVMVRADMDALPIHEQTGLPYASQHEGRMHACGHDGHTTMLLGAARHLARTRRFSGTVHLIFQPAEEVGKNSGAQQMIADGLFKRFPCDAIFGLHNHPGYPEGTMMFGSGAFLAASDTYTIAIHGRGGHAARPQLAVDPIVAASSLVMALQTIVSRNVDPAQIAIITVGAFNAGTAPNIIPDTATLRMSVRSFSETVRRQMYERITTLAKQHAESYGASASIDYEEGYPVLVNTEEETAFALKVATELLGEDRVTFPFGPVTGSEDFAYYLQHKPGSFLRLGNGRDCPMLHHPKYDFHDDNLTVGAAYWARLVERFLSEA